MADSAITITSLSATPGVGQNLIAFTTLGGTLSGCLPYLALSTVEVWASATNNRAAASLVGTGAVSLVDGGLGVSQTKYYWARAKDASGLYGAWYPASATAGIVSTTSDQVPPNGSVSDAQVSSLSADKVIAGTLSSSNLRVSDGAGNFIILADANTAQALFWKPLLEMATASNLASATLNAIYAQSINVEAIYGYGATGSGNCHGVRGQSSGGTSGIVGAATGYDFYADGSGTNYGPFTGAHDALVTPDDDAVLEIGDILVDVECLVRGGVSNTLFKVARCTAAAQKGAVGVVAVKNGLLADNMIPAVFARRTMPPKFWRLSSDPNGPMILPPEPMSFTMPEEMAATWDALKDAYHYVLMNAVGEGQVNVCGEGGNIAAGDLIAASSTPGKGMKQADDIVRATTVAKAREAASFGDPSDVKLIACIYLCG